jgi:hypothetical protein
MDPVEMLRYMDKHPNTPSSSGFKVYDQNGNSWAYVYPTQYDAEVAIEKLATVGETMKTVSGTNITVGGEGMRKFYDQQIPSNVRALGKKFGLKVEDINLESGGLGEWKLIKDSDNGFFHEWVFEGPAGERRTLSGDNEREARSRLEDWIRETGAGLQNAGMQQKGVWLSPDSRSKITQQSFPLFANPDAPHMQDELTTGMSDRQVTALDNFLKWRNSVVKTYRQMGIPINELERYVPFIPKRMLKKEEASTLRSVFGTGIKEANQDNFDTLLATLQKQDPNLKKRTTQATRPSEVNAMLSKDWLTEDAAVAMNIRGTRAIKAQEFSKFADEFVSTYGLKMGDISQLGSIPDGYAAYQVGFDKDGTKVFREINSIPNATDNDIDTIFLPKEMVNLFNEYSNTAFNKYKQNELLNIVDGLNRMYKKAAYLWNPGHIMRDFEGNVFNNYLMGVKSLDDYSDGFKVVRGSQGVVNTPNGPLSYSEILEKAQTMGVIDSQLANELPTLSGRKESKYSNLMRNATYATDGWTRATGFVHNLKKGMNYSEAAAQTKKYLFDYMDLTPFERNVMKRIVPFYTWMRKNIPLQISMLLKNPRFYARINDLQNYVAGGEIDWKSKPDYVRNSMAIQPEGSNFYVNPNLPYTDLARVPVNLDTLGGLMSNVTPLIQTPVESITNQDWFTMNPLESYQGQQTSAPIVDALAKIAGVPVNKDNIAVPVDARVTGNILSSVPIITRITNLIETLAGQQSSQVKNLSRISTTVGGPSFYDAAAVQASATKEQRDRLVDLIQKLKAGGVEVPTTQELKKSSQSSYDRLKSVISGGR